MRKNGPLSVVIMGDLVRSRQTSDLKKLHRSFNNSVDKMNTTYKASLKSPLTITLGDEFQGIVSSLAIGFEIVSNLRMSLLEREIESRMVVGLASIETSINQKVAWNMMGLGLSEAREALNDKKDFSAYRFSFPQNLELEMTLNGLGASLTHLEKGWTKTQRKYVTSVLKSEKTKSEIAQELGVLESSLYKSLRSAEFQFYLQQKYTIENVLSLMDEEILNG